MKKVVEEGPQVFEWKARHKTGRLFWIEVNMRQAVIDGQDRILVVVRDITERKRAEEKLQFRNVLLSTQQEASIDGIWWWMKRTASSHITVGLWR